MSTKDKLNKIKQVQKKLDNFLVVSMLLIVAAGSLGVPYINDARGLVEWIIYGVIGFIVFGGIATTCGKWVDKYIQTKWIKSYFIEECGDVVKLHGSVRADSIDEACKDLLSTRPGLKLVEDAYAQYGCTFAATNASEQEKKARDELRKNGIEIMTMSRC